MQLAKGIEEQSLLQWQCAKWWHGPVGKGLAGQSRSDISEAAASTLDGDSSLPSGIDQSRSSPGTAEDWRVLMSAERCDFTGTVTDEPSAMPWSHARMQAGT